MSFGMVQSYALLQGPNIPLENATIAEMLVESGYSTYIVGKWRLCPEDEMNQASTKRNWPLGRGFERFYGFLGAKTNQYYPDLVHDNHPVDPPATPEEGYHFTEDYDLLQAPVPDLCSVCRRVRIR